VVARFGSYYRNMRYIMVTLVIAFGAWFGYDGFVGYPEHNRKYDEIARRMEEAQRREDNENAARAAEELRKHGARKTDTDIAFQKWLCFSLPPLGLAYLAFVLYRSRGEFRLEGSRLSIPGGKTLDLSQVKSVDNTLWDRKGIAIVNYDGGSFKLDDFIYEAKPIRAIHEAIMKRVAPTEAAKDHRDALASEADAAE
jgi:hypothetical protein